jgi:protein-disulfide isomerase
MKKTPIIVTIIVIAFMGLGFLLYKISPQPEPGLELKGFDYSQVQKTDKPRPVEQDDHILGNQQAKNVLIAYEDLQCPACRNFEPILKQLPAELNDTKLVFRHYPLYPRPHQNALVAAYGSEAAAAQGKFWEFANLMYERQDEWTDLKNPLEKMAEIAAAAGVGNIEQFKSDVLSSKYSEKIQKDNFEALGMGVGGTPSLYYNGTKVEVGSVASIKAQIEKLPK